VYLILPRVTHRFAVCCSPNSAVVYSGNIHSVGGEHAIFATALDGARFQGNALGGYINTRVYQSAPAQQACGKLFPHPGEYGTAHAPALVGFGIGDLSLVRHVTLNANDGWCYQTPWPTRSAAPAHVSNGGVIQLIWPTDKNERRSDSQTSLPPNVNWDTILIISTNEAARSMARTHFDEAASPPKWQAVGSTPMVAVDKLSRVLDGCTLYAVSCARDECAAVLFAANLTDFPSTLAGQSVYVGLQLRATGKNGAMFRLEIADGRDVQPITTTNASLGLDQGWSTHSAFATLAWAGQMSVILRVFGAATLEVGMTTIAPIGQ
jgi:hypothetical protein